MRIFYRTKQAVLVGGDLISFVAGFYFSLTIRFWELPTWLLIEKHLIPFSIVFGIWLILNYINGLYDLERQSLNARFYRRVIEAAGISLFFGMAFFYLFPDQKLAPKTILVLNIVLGYGLLGLWRFFNQKLIRTEALQTKVLIVGHTPEVDFVADVTHRRPEKGYEIVAVIDPENEPHNHVVPTYQHLEEMNHIIATHGVDLVVVAPHLQKNSAAEQQLYNLLFSHIGITDLPSFYEVLTGRIPPSTFSEGWFLQNLKNAEKPIYDRLRGITDYVISLLMLVIFIVLLPFVAGLIKATSKGPIFIKQKRVGQNGQEFILYKFRSMYALSPDGSAEIKEVQFAVKGDKRITPLGKILRRTRLDELPQVVNLLKREVTIIGPRPERPEIVSKLTEKMPYYPLRHLVRPGLTGWALIHQNYTDNYDTSLQKLQYDLYYIKNRSFVLDLVISLRTINVIIRLMGQ
jgi:exopolysaccharide biosynthesis polyprenyl glycosylphosphotransferase